MLWTVLALSAGSGCRSHGASAAGPAPRTPRLEALPPTATIAWVHPSVLIAGATSEDDESAALGSVRSMRLDVEAVLKGERWTFVDADTAQFAASIAIVTRSRFEHVRRVIAGTEARPPTCDATRSARPCPPPPKPQYETVSVHVTDSRAIFAIRRRRDGARREHTVTHVDARTSGGLFAKLVIELLRAR